MLVEDNNDWSDRQYDFSYSNLSKKIDYFFKGQIKYERNIKQKFTMATLTSILGNQLIYLMSLKQKPAFKNIISLIKSNINSTRRPTQLAITTFVIKNILDFYTSIGSQYKKGAIVGLLTYLLNRPFDQIQIAKKIIYSAQNKSVSTLEAIKAIIRYDGLKGFYKNQNLLAPISSTIYRSIYFGLYYRIISQSYQNLNFLKQYIAYPLLASAAASVSTILIDKLRSTYLYIHQLQNTTITKKYSKAIFASQSVTKQVLEMFSKGELKITYFDLKVIFLSVMRNWILLSFYAFGQSNYAINTLKKYAKLVQT